MASVVFRVALPALSLVMTHSSKAKYNTILHCVLGLVGGCSYLRKKQERKIKVVVAKENAAVAINEFRADEITKV